MIKTIAIDASRANVENKTGVEWYAYRLIQELKSIIPFDHKVILYTREPLRGELANLPALWESRVLKWPPKVMWSQFRLAWELFRRPPDLFFEPSHVVPFLFPKNTVNTMHDVAFARFPKAYTPWGLFYLIVTTVYAKLRGVQFIAVSEFSKRELLELFRIKPETISVVPLAQSLSGPAADPDTTLAKYHITKPFFLFVGRLETKKNLGRIVAAYKKCTEILVTSYKLPVTQLPQLILVGKKGVGYENELANFDLTKEPNIKILGYVPEPEVIALYQSATAFVFPSLYEGFGIPILEAMQNGCPVITSSITSLPEIAGNAASIVDPTSVDMIAIAMTKVATDQQLHAELIRRGHLRAAEFSWRTTAEKTWNILSKKLQSK